MSFSYTFFALHSIQYNKQFSSSQKPLMTCGQENENQTTEDTFRYTDKDCREIKKKISF